MNKVIKESLTVEYKREYSETIKKSIIAFANTNGGSITIGIDDNGDIIGVNDSDLLIRQVTDSIREGIKPDVSLFTKCEHKELEGKDLVEIIVQKGTASPYYLANKGIRPEGVFIRQGASSVPASETAILNMIKESSGESYEERRSLNQDLTFTSLTNEFKEANIKLEEAQFRSLHLQGTDGLYTNLALLLSDQCNASIRLAIFEGTNKETFKDRHEFTGSLLAQLHDCYSLIERNNKTESRFDGLKRLDSREYPSTAIRETLLNCLTHREYALSGSTLIAIFDDRLEFTTLGGLVKGICKDDILLGISLLRNKNLANIFYRLKLIESYGTGIQKIMESYYAFTDICPAPKLEITDNAFKMTLYNTKFSHNSSYFIQNSQFLSAKEKEIVKLFEKQKHITRKDVENALNISQTMAINYLKSLSEKGYIIRIGQGKNQYYCSTNYSVNIKK